MMKKDDLKSTLDKIQPRKELIDDTIRKANELRFSQKKSSIFDAFNFNFKFATALCALFLVVCVGIIAFNNGIFTNAGLSSINISALHAVIQNTHSPREDSPHVTYVTGSLSFSHGAAGFILPTAVPAPACHLK